MNKKILTGQTNEHVKIFWEGQLNLIPEVAEAFLDMSSAAKKDGLVLSVVSTFRSFDDQLRIWNQKFKGTMDVLDLNEEKITIGNLNEFEKIEKILYWSALPGGSRHHWGTDIDVVERNAISKNIEYRLVPSESKPNGIFYQLYLWLKKESRRFGFYFPYQGINANMYHEPWHISYASIANQNLSAMKPEMIREAVISAEISGKTQIIKNLLSIYQNKILNVCSN
ncbi:MAG: M15 family metallopeptidase [Deltaproteobacteria bacterium]|jgi:LAS superfamily LD-carboxypeptidase LdcB|nr:M15 family metallopeptidase [Deltaproteobacteria bacterium]